MKNIVIITAIFLSLPNLTQAQVHQHALGLRYGTGYGLTSSEFSYQLGLNPKNRIEFGLGFRQRDLGIFKWRQLSTSMYYQHVMNIHGGFNWFVGAGIKHNISQRIENGTASYHQYLSLGPTVGLEYDFNKKNVPLVLAIDYRPSFEFYQNSNHTTFKNQFGLSLRYTFKDKEKPNFEE